MTSTIKVDTISENTSANGVAVDGVTLKDGQVDLADSKKILLGDGDDFLIYHDGSNSYIDNQTGELRLKTSVFKFQNANNSETMISASENGAVNLFYDNSKKFETTSAGITVTGTATVVDDISISGATPTITLTDTDDNSDCMVYQGAGNLYLEADKNSEASGSFLRIAVDDLDFVHIYNGEAVFNESSRDQDFRVESNGNTHMLFVDGGSDHVNIGTASDLGGTLNVEGTSVFRTTGNENTLSLISTDADASAGPILRLARQSASPADGDTLGAIQWQALDDGAGNNNMIQIIGSMTDASAGSEDATLYHYQTIGGATVEMVRYTPTGPVFNEGSADLDFRIESNSDANMLFVNGGNDRVGIGSASPESVLHVEEGTSPKITVRSADGTSASIKLQRINENDASTDFELKNDGGVFKIISDNSSINERPLATFESAQVTFNEDSHDVDFRIESNSDANAFFVDGGNDRVGFFTNSPDNQIDLKRAGSAIMKIESTNNGDDAKLLIKKAGSSSRNMVGFVSDNTWHVGHLRNATTTFSIATNDDSNSSNEFRVTSSGVLIAGSLAKGSGSFKIEHPHPDKKDTHNLVHSFVEAPQADNIYRGKVDLVGGSATVNVDTVSGMTDGTFVLLNTDVQCFTSNETGWTAVKGSVSGNILTITAEDNSCTDTISWMVVGERHDQHMKDTDWTDVDGKVIVEPLKEIEEVE